MNELLAALGAGACVVCEAAAAGVGPAGALCEACWEAVPAEVSALPSLPVGVVRGWQLAPYAGPLGGLVRHAKYAPDPGVLRAVGALLAESAPEGGYHSVVPVPSSLFSLLWRGFVPAEVLARPVAARLGVPLVRGLVRRGFRRRASQARRLRDAVVDVRARRAVTGRVLLVDDVLTTGGTAGACARTLLEAGAERVDLLVVAAGRQLVSTA